MSDDSEYDLSEYLQDFDRGLTAPEAFYAIMAAAVFADGIRDDRETEELRALSHRTVTLTDFARKEPTKFSELEKSTLARFEGQQGPDLARKALELAKDACATIRQSKEAGSLAYSAYAHAVDIVLADSRVKDLEMKFLNVVAKELQIPRRDAAEILTVLGKKNKH